MKNITLDRATVLQLDPDGTDRALDAAANCDVLRNDAALNLCALADQEIRGAQLALDSAEDLRGPLHSMLPTIDMPEPMQEPVPAFVVGSGLAPACSTTECCCCTVLSMTSAAFAAALSFSGALLLKLLNMSTSRFRRHALRERAKAVFLRSSASWRRAFYSPRGETLRLGRHLRTGLRKRELPPRWRVPNSERRGTLRSPTGS